MATRAKCGVTILGKALLKFIYKGFCSACVLTSLQIVAILNNAKGVSELQRHVKQIKLEKIVRVDTFFVTEHHVGYK